MRLSLEINKSLAVESQNAIDAGSHYNAIKTCFNIFQRALKKELIYKKELAQQKKEAINHMFDMFNKQLK